MLANDDFSTIVLLVVVVVDSLLILVLEEYLFKNLHHSAYAHIPNIERYIPTNTISKKTICLLAYMIVDVPFVLIPDAILIHLAINAISSYQLINGISKNMFFPSYNLIEGLLF